jgi:fermentation-respiration switch protein FrsA (DUF1100 family)
MLYHSCGGFSLSTNKCVDGLGAKVHSVCSAFLDLYLEDERSLNMRQDIEFNAEGTTLRGWLYLPDAGHRPFPTIVMAHGFSAVKEMYLDRFAEVFANAGLAALVFDNRNFGASDGEPRQEIDPWAQVRDYRHAITYARTRPEVDRERIGIWGSSYSGGHVVVVGAIDRRVKCVVSQVPLTSGYRNILRLVRADFIAGIRAQFDQDREARFAGNPPAMIPVVHADPTAQSALPTADSYQWFTETGNTRAPAWKNEVTVRTVEMLMEYEPGTYIERISPTPLLMIIAAGDHLAVADEAFAAFNLAREPKKLVVLPGGHFEAYVEPGFELASGAARDWFVQHLRQGVEQSTVTPV